MSNKPAPTYNPPPPQQLPTATEIYSAAGNYANQNFPTQMAAQATALKNVNDPNYYASFQPTSLESALGNQYFKNVWPDESAAIKNQMSLSGMAYSPALAETLGRAQGGLETQVGSYLSDQANSRATNSINAGLSMNPMSFIQPYASTDLTQRNNQAQLQYGYQQALANQQYQQQMNKYQQQQALGSTIGQISPIGGQIYGAATGTSGSALSGTANTMNGMAPLMMMYDSGGMDSGFGMTGYGGGNNNSTGLDPNAQSYSSLARINSGAAQQVH